MDVEVKCEKVEKKSSQLFEFLSQNAFWHPPHIQVTQFWKSNGSSALYNGYYKTTAINSMGNTSFITYLKFHLDFKSGIEFPGGNGMYNFSYLN